jgi:hypothetical protein
MREERLKVLRDGFVAGLIGYVTVALVFAVANLLAGRSAFHTAAALGGALFYGVHDPDAVAITARNVFAYNGMHLLVFLAFGLAAAGLAALADKGAQLWYLATFFFLFIAFHLVAIAQTLAAPMQTVLSPAMIWSAGIAASVLMGGYLIWAHPLLRRSQPWDD